MRDIYHNLLQWLELFLPALISGSIKNLLLSLVVFGAPTENGRSGATVTEIMDLAGTHYC